MIRTQIQLDEYTWEALRKAAFQKKRSIASLIREMVRAQIFPKPKNTNLRLKDFTFVGSGRSRGKGAGSIAQHHDEAFADSIL